MGGSSNPEDCVTASPEALQLVSLAVDERTSRVFALGHPTEVAELRGSIELVE